MINTLQKFFPEVTDKDELQTLITIAKENDIIGSGITVKFKLSTRGDVPWKREFEIK